MEKRVTFLTLAQYLLSSAQLSFRSAEVSFRPARYWLVARYWLLTRCNRSDQTWTVHHLSWISSAKLTSSSVQSAKLSSAQLNQLSSLSSAQLSSLSSARSAQLSSLSSAQLSSLSSAHPSSARSAHSSTIRQYVEPAYLSWSQVCWPCHKCGTAIPKLYRIEQSCTLNQGTHKGCTNIGDPFYPGAWITIVSNIWEMQYQWWLHFLCPLPLSTHNFWICVGKSFTYFCHVWGGGRAQQGPSAWEPFWRLCPPIQNPVCAHALDKALSWLKINPVKEATYYFNLTKNHVTSGIYLCTVECWNYSFKKL